MDVAIKVCGITNQQDAELALDLGAEYLGIIVYQKSPRAVPMGEIPNLLRYIPRGKRVLVDVSTPTDVLDQYKELPFDAYQLHFDLEVAIATVAAWSGLVGAERLWLAPRVPPEEDYFPQITMEFAHTIVLDAYSKSAYGGTGRTGDWQRFLDWSTLYQHKRWILAGGLNPDNIGDALRATQAEMVDVNSGVESEPGKKDPEKLRAFFRAVREAASELPQ
ncbi:MAG: phosphoribosylanthranilate isomerase [Puniceicoccaceae bacterium 5H]|nr:MAG: phosphoribosylanthranilate isomerase [Puniceicoccaceae bacterium 5H]